jgi:ketosteroid isomerase-like protein
VIPGRLRRDGSPPPAELTEDVGLVRAMYRALGRDDLGALDDTVSQDVGWIDPFVARFPFDGTRRGLPSVLRAAFRLEHDGTGPRVCADTFLELGDGVLVAGRFLDEANGAAEPFLHECLVRGGKVFLIRGFIADDRR